MANQIAQLSKDWMEAWNQRDLPKLVAMMKPDSMFGQMQAFFYPIIKHDQPLIPELYVSERFSNDIKKLQEAGITFTIEEIKTGEDFVRILYKLSNDWFGMDFLRFENGLIDQVIRNVDALQWKF
jgi:ketosteroid isomerase-like protein